MRSLATDSQLRSRWDKQVGLSEIFGKEVWIDGFNTIITREVLFSDSILLSCMDGTIRDLAALRGTYRLIPKASKVIHLMCDLLQEAKVEKVNILLDQPVSNFGRLNGYTGAVKPPVRRSGNRESGHMETVLYAAEPPSQRDNLQDGDANIKVLLFT